MQRHGNVKDIQAHLRHASPDVTAGVYMQEIPESVRAAVEALDRELNGPELEAPEARVSDAEVDIKRHGVLPSSLQTGC
jgi:hypothetical protein